MQSLGSMYETRSYHGGTNQRHGGDFCGCHQQFCGSHQLENDGASRLHIFCVVEPRRTDLEKSFTLVTLTFLIILTNSALFNLRSRASPDPIPTQASHQLSPYPHPQFPVPGSGHHNTSGAGTNVGGYGMSGESATAGAGQIGWSNEGKKKGRFW